MKLLKKNFHIILLFLYGFWDSFYVKEPFLYLFTQMKGKIKRRSTKEVVAPSFSLLKSDLFIFNYLYLILYSCISYYIISFLEEESVTYYKYFITYLIHIYFNLFLTISIYISMICIFLVGIVINIIELDYLSSSNIYNCMNNQVSFMNLPFIMSQNLIGIAIPPIIMIQNTVLKRIPYIGFYFICFLTSILYSLYTFEYIFSHYSTLKRLSIIESNLPYFFGFGLNLFIPIYLSSYHGLFISNGVWSILFPIFILLGHRSNRKLSISKHRLRLFALPVKIITFILHFILIHVCKKECK